MRRGPKRLLVALGVLALLLVAARAALDPLVTWRTRKVLAGMEGMRGRFQDVEVSVHDLSYAITGLRIEKLGPEGEALPYFQVERARFGLYFKELLGGHVVAAVDLEAPKLTLVSAKAPSREQGVEEAPEVGRGLEELTPFLLDRLQVKDGELLWVDESEPEKPELWLHRLEGTLENFATRKALAKNEPTVLAARGVLQRSGAVSVFATADPLAKKLTFAGQGRLEGLKLAELATLVGSKAGIAPDRGELDMSVRFRAEDGRISGGVRPIVKDGGMRPAKDGLGAKLKALLADASLELFSDDVAGRDAVATTIPLEGTVHDPKAQAVPTVLGILRNAFVRGLQDGLSGLPPPKAREKEGVLKQARRALSPKREAQPRAQPEGKGE
ncbi:DUF748 domain-containing protein [Anaeromyxobacter sp. Fw109-5]|uniref:DUF748 domain-containing protein n=1 Tax=Anaeromyxobacter sp. (strain Fw109-5) TaxID=404589 RepID=UPI0000ED81AF|nr:DUF748 domain-containing protein [Anaeromyxobacter sp. Fw109-5]ABS25948.1 conserved hypothetical protein [Anaeromyxobacter sp. Fw109-5]